MRVAGRVRVPSSAGTISGTLVSRLTGMARIVVIGAIFGPTLFANLFQVANQFPNLLFDLLCGSLFTSILVPALVRHIDLGDKNTAQLITNRFFGLVVGFFGACTLIVIASSHWLVHVLASAALSHGDSVEEGRAALLVALLAPQLVLYGLIGVAWALQNAAGRFTFPALAPTIENVVGIAMLLAFTSLFPVPRDLSAATDAQIYFLGIGSTLAVAFHAAIQWMGTARAGFVLKPMFAKPDAELAALIRLSLPAMGYASLNTARLIVGLVAATAIPGGVVAFQLGYNFYSLIEALIARPVGQVFLPQLTRAASDSRAAFSLILTRNLTLVGLLALPAAVALMIAAPLLSELFAAGDMGTAAGRALVSTAIAALAIGGLCQSLVFTLVAAHYARRRPVAPLLVAGARFGLTVLGLLVLARLGGETLLGVGLTISTVDLIALIGLSVPALRDSTRTGRQVAIGMSVRIGLIAALTAAAMLGVVNLPLVQQLSAAPQLSTSLLAGGAGFVAGCALFRSKLRSMLGNRVAL